MADNVSVTPGSGAVIGTDEVTDGTLGTVQIQYFKQMDGTLNSTNKRVVNSSGQAYVLDPDTVSTGNSLSLTNTTNNVSISLNGDGTVGVQISAWAAGSGSAPAVIFEATTDGANWAAVPAVVPSTGASVTTASGNGLWQVDASGFQSFRVRSTVAGTGASATVALVANGTTSVVSLDAPLPAGTNSIGTVDTELPPAVTIADPTSWPSVPIVGGAVLGHNSNDGKLYRAHVYDFSADAASQFFRGLWSGAMAYGYNGTGWDRLRADTTAGLWTQLKAALPAGSNTIGAVTQGTTPWTIQGEQSAATTGTITSATSTVTVSGATNYNLATVGIYGTYAGVSAVFEASPDGTNWFSVQGQRTDSGVIETGPTTLGSTIRAWDVFIGGWTQMRVRATAWTSGTANVVVVLQTMPTEPAPSVMLQPTTAGGCSSYSFLSTAAALSASIKSSPGQVYSLAFFNNSATIAYVRLYNQTTAPATTDSANIIWRGLIPGNTSGAGFTHEIANAIQFITGIGIRVTAAVADADATALAANTVIGNVKYR